MNEKAIEAAAKTIPALIEKLSGLKGPDREVDALLWAWLDGRSVREDRDALFGKRREPPHDECLLGWRAMPVEPFICADYIPAYTGSLDAVTALIERDGTWDWSIFRDNGEAIAGVQPASEDGCDCADAHALTPALALLIAFLEAKMEIAE